MTPYRPSLALFEPTKREMAHAARTLGKNPGYGVVVVLTLALGIGANTALFSVVHAVLLRSLPYPQAGELVSICERNLSQGWERYAVSLADFYNWRDQNSVFQELAAAAPGVGQLSGPEGPEQIHAAFASANLFPMLGIEPALGRNFRPEEDQRERANVVILSHRLWETRFRGDTNIVGKAVTLSGREFSVVGVLSQSFRFFTPQNVAGIPVNVGEADLWRPLTVWPAALKWRANRDLMTVGRLRPGVSVDQARNEFKMIADRIAKANPDSNGGWSVAIEPLQELVTGKWRAMIAALFGAAGFVLVIVCANVACLALARSASRRKEFAVRLAIGASRFRLVRQVLAENLILAVLGGALGLLLAHWAIDILVAMAPAGIPRLDEARLDYSVLGFAVAAIVFVGFGFGIVPAIRASRIEPSVALAEEGRGSSDGPQGSLLRNGLVVGQMAIALTLLGSAGLMFRTMGLLNEVDPGFRPDRILACDLAPSGPRYANGVANIRLVDQLLARLRGLPQFASAAVVYGAPFGKMTDSDISVQLDGIDIPNSNTTRVASLRQASPGYFDLMGIPVLRGRAIERSDATNSLPVVVVNEAFARKYLPNLNPLGRRVSSPDLGPSPAEIVGIIRDVKATGLDAPIHPEVYQPFAQGGMWQFSVVAKTAVPPKEWTAALKRELAAIDPDQPISNVRAIKTDMVAQLAPRRFVMMLLSAFAALALILAALGLYGVLAFNLSRRTREMGIRIALGAQRGDIVRLALGFGLKLTLLGLLAGGLGAVGASRLLASLLYQVRPGDPTTLAIAVLVLGASGLAACWFPARQAAAVDPLVALRTE
jgi:putative ABC transport system permease protein